MRADPFSTKCGKPDYRLARMLADVVLSEFADYREGAVLFHIKELQERTFPQPSGG